MATTYVATFAELKTAIEDANSTDIKVTSNITFTSGIKVNIAKSELVIDFGGFTITDYNSSSFTDTIYIASTTNTIAVTAKNATWIGRNYYGVIGVYDGNSNSTITLENINYTGPQFVYNKYGSTIIKDCTVLLDKGSSSTSPQEFCEANRLKISGNVTVTSNTTGTAVIWFTGAGASLTIEQNSKFDITALSTYLLYTDVSPVITFKQGSSTTITTKSGLFYAASSSSHIASSFTLEENASFIAYKTTSNSVPMFKCISNLTIGKNATFRLYNQSTSTTALVYFGQVANIKIDAPKSVVLYNNGGNIFNFQTGSASSPNTITINAEMMNLWNTATTPLANAGIIADLPTTQFHKADYSSNFNATITLSNSQVLSVENDLTTADVGYPMTVSSLNLLASKVISLGAISLAVNNITDISNSIAGLTENNANLKATFNETTLSGVASSTGEFDIPVDQQIEVGTTVGLTSNTPFLTKTISLISEGSVSISMLEDLNFFAFVAKSNQNIIYRQKDNWQIEVKDTRTSGENWYLYAYINQPLTSNLNKLENSLIFVDESTKILSATPTLIYTGKWSQQNQTTQISWAKEKGFLLQISPETNYIAGKYNTDILWDITTSPLDLS